MATRITSLEVREGVYDYASATGVAGAVEWHVNFADPRLFTAYGTGFFAQDEMQVAEHPGLGALRGWRVRPVQTHVQGLRYGRFSISISDTLSNAVYYTFSTVAQTLAGAIALLAAFVLYRLQSVNQVLVRDGERVAVPLAQLEPKANEMVELGKFQDLLDAANNADYPPGHGQAKIERARLAASLHTHTVLVEEFRFALYLTAATIVYAVAALVFAPIILRSSIVSGAVLAVGLLAFIWCIIRYVVVLRSSIV